MAELKPGGETAEAFMDPLGNQLESLEAGGAFRPMNADAFARAMIAAREGDVKT